MISDALRIPSSGPDAGRHFEPGRPDAASNALLGRVRLLVLAVAGLAAYGIWLAQTAPGGVPAWLWPIAALVGAVAVVTLAVSTVEGRRPVFLSAAIALGTTAALFIPSVASAQLVAEHHGAFDTPFESPAPARALDQLFIQTPWLVAATIPGLKGVQLGAPYLLAAQTSAVASVFITSSGTEALPIGGFTGTIPEPTLTHLEADIRAGKFHLVLAAPSRDPRLAWIASHCRPVGRPVGALHAYFCLPPDARGG